MNDREFSDIEIFQHSGKGMPLFMTDHKNCLQSDYLLGPDPRLIKKNLPGRGLIKVEKHCLRTMFMLDFLTLSMYLSHSGVHYMLSKGVNVTETTNYSSFSICV
jgi:hypothetical protein